MRVTPYQLLPTTEIFIAATRGEVAATVSLVRDGRRGLPMEAIYGEEVRNLRRRGLRLGEVSCLADHRPGGKKSPALALRLMSLMAQCAERRGLDQLLIAVHPRHGRFYQRFTAFRPIGGLKTYEAVCGRPAVALALDLNRAPFDHPNLYEQFFGVNFPCAAFKCHPTSETIRREFEPVVEASYDASAYMDELAMAG
ncbi:MAG: N-acyl amino acid synthase FeeM domain-containing protein [Thermoguttaceae bacterium]